MAAVDWRGFWEVPRLQFWCLNKKRNRNTMISINVPAASRRVSDRIKNLYEGIGYQAINAVVCFFLFNKSSMSDVVRDCPFAPSVSTMGRKIQKFPPNRLTRRATASFLKKFRRHLDDSDRYVFVIDDTDNPRYGKGFKGVGLWGCSKGVYLGQKIVCLIVVDTKTRKSYPLGYRIATKESDSTCLDLAADLVEEALSSGVPTFPVVTDSWFSSVDFMEKLNDLGCEYIGEIKSNRKVKTSPGPYAAWVSLCDAIHGIERKRVITPWDSKKIREGKKRGKTLAERVLMIKKRKSPVKITAMFNRKNSLTAFAYYISSDRTSSGARIWMMSRVRWSIECVFRTCKQCLSFGNLSCTGEYASHLAVEMPLYLYGLVQLEPGMFGGREGDSVDLILSRLKEETFSKSLDVILADQRSERLELLRNRHSTARASRKPCNTAAAGY